MDFPKLFKIPKSSPKYLKLIENHYCKLIKSTQPVIVVEDHLREIFLLRQILKSKKSKKTKSYGIINQVHFPVKRELNPFKIFQLIDNSIKVDSSCPNLKLALELRDLDLFLKSIIENNYELNLIESKYFGSNSWWFFTNEKPIFKN